MPPETSTPPPDSPSPDPVVVFRRMWAGGKPPTSKEFLSRWKTQHGRVTNRQMIDVVRSEQECRWDAGLKAKASDYLGDLFPELRQSSRMILELIRGEILLRIRDGEKPTLAEYTFAFPEMRQALEQEWPTLVPQEDAAPPEVQGGDQQPVQKRAHRSLLPSSRDQPLKPLQEGFQLGGYILDRRLGEGGFGEVWLARDPELDRLVALKIAIKVRANGVLERFKREAQVLARLDDPGFCPIYHSGKVDGRHFIAMKYFEKDDLSKQIGPGRLWEPKRAAAVVARIARQMHKAHEAGVIHRDLKPQNLIVDEPSGLYVVLDFGLAKKSGEDGLTGDGSLGTAEYTAPEQWINASQVGRPADVWSLGAILYLMLAGRTPFQGNAAELCEAICKKTAPLLTKFRANVPHELQAICLKALERLLDRRYPNMAAFADALEAWLEDQTVAPSRQAPPLVEPAIVIPQIRPAPTLKPQTPPHAEQPSESGSSRQEILQPESRLDFAVPPVKRQADKSTRTSQTGRASLRLVAGCCLVLACTAIGGALVYHNGALPGQPPSAQGGSPKTGPSDTGSAETKPTRKGPDLALVRKLMKQARVHIQEKNPGLALKDLEEAIAITPNNPDVLNCKGWALNESGEHEAAIDASTKALEIDRQFGPGYITRATAYNQTGKFKDALDDADQAIKYEAKDCYSWYNRALALRGLGRLKLASEALARAREIEPTLTFPE